MIVFIISQLCFSEIDNHWENQQNGYDLAPLKNQQNYQNSLKGVYQK